MIHLKLQKPTIELLIKAKDSAGEKDQVRVGFKRYNLEEANGKLKELKLYQDNIYLYSVQELREEYKLLGEDKDVSKLPEPTLSLEETKKKLDNFIKNQIVYLKDINGLIRIDADGKEKEFSVSDTRTVKPIETLWGTPEECLSVLVDSFLESAPYRVSFISGVQKALSNVDYQDGEIKN